MNGRAWARYTAVARWVFSVVFLLGSVVHLILGRTNPDSYAAFGTTAVPPLARLWEAWVMPNIGILTILMALYEVALAIGLARGVARRGWQRGQRSSSSSFCSSWDMDFLPMALGGAF